MDILTISCQRPINCHGRSGRRKLTNYQLRLYQTLHFFSSEKTCYGPAVRWVALDREKVWTASAAAVASIGLPRLLSMGGVGRLPLPFSQPPPHRHLGVAKAAVSGRLRRRPASTDTDRMTWHRQTKELATLSPEKKVSEVVE